MVSTGDTITVSSGNNELYRVRIYGIVSPKLDESFGNEARVYLSRQILGKSISIVTKKSTNEGQLLAEVFMNGINIGIEQVRAGLARLAIDQSSQPDENFFRPYLDAEFMAKSGRFGIWAGGINGLTTIANADNDGVASNPQVPYRSSRGNSKFRFTGMNSPFDPSNEPVELVLQEVPASNDSTVRTERDPAPGTVGPTNDGAAQVPTETPVEADPVKPHTTSKEVTPGRTYTRGSRGGCYYLSASRNRVYVDRSLCN
jgi:endonuclease YncB( thermonuclease family)